MVPGCFEYVTDNTDRCSLPRRFGKTIALSVFTAAILLTRGCSVLVMSMSGRAADSLLAAIREAIVNMIKTIGAPVVITANSKQEFAFRLHGIPRSVKSLPSMNIRGQGGDIILLDEVCFMNLSTLLESVFPMAEKKNCILICISSPSPTTLHGIFKNVTMKDSYSGQERRVFNTLSVQLACTRCIHEGQAHKCVHQEHLVCMVCATPPLFSDFPAQRPAWKDAARGHMFSELYSALGRSDTFAAESLGLPQLTRNSIYPVQILQTLFNKMDRPQCVDIHQPSFIVIGSDISGGMYDACSFNMIQLAHGVHRCPLEHDLHCFPSTCTHGRSGLRAVRLSGGGGTAWAV